MDVDAADADADAAPVLPALVVAPAPPVDEIANDVSVITLGRPFLPLFGVDPPAVAAPDTPPPSSLAPEEAPPPPLPPPPPFPVLFDKLGGIIIGS